MENIEENALPSVSGLVVLLKEKNFSEETALAISPAFDELYNTAKEWNTKATEFLNNPDLLPEEKAKEARAARLALVKVRTGIEKKRKELNDSDQKRIDERNAIGKVLTGLVTPTEKILQDEEDRAANIEKQRKAALKNERLAHLEPYKVDSQFFDLENMPAEAFAVLLENSSLAHQKRIDDEEKLIKEKAEKEKINTRIQQIVNLGFEFDNEDGRMNGDYRYYFEYFKKQGEVEDFEISIPAENFKLSDKDWIEMLAAHIAKIEQAKEQNKKDKEAEDNLLKAEKKAAERKAQLLEQQEKERKARHDEALARQKKLSDIKVIEAYQKLYDMDEASFNDYFTDKNQAYQAEQNRLFIEKKKKEREDALAKEKAEAEAKAKREEALAPDKIKLKIFVDRIHNVVKEFESNEFTNEEARLLYKNFFGMMERANQWANEHIEKLK